MKKILGHFICMIALGVLINTARADGGPDCGYYDGDNFVFTGDLGFTQWDQGNPHHDVTPTFSASGTVAANTSAYFHNFDISPDGESGVVWQLKYCLFIEDEDGNYAVFGRKKYFEVVDNAYIFDSQYDEFPIAANHFEDLYQPQAVWNFYTVDNANNTSDDYMSAVLSKYGEGDLVYNLVAAWVPLHSSCEE